MRTFVVVTPNNLVHKNIVARSSEDIDTIRRYLHMANEILASQGCISHLDGILNGEI